MQRALLLTAALTFSLVFAGVSSAVNVTIDYSFDTNNFFGSGNPDGAAAGAQARATLDAAAAFYSGILEDTLDEIRTPDPLVVTPPGFPSPTATSTFTWSTQFTNPTTGTQTTITDPTIPANEYIIYAGARSLGGSTLGIGGPGGFSANAQFSGFTQAQIDAAEQVFDDFGTLIRTRGEESGFANWGGAITFDSDNSTNWHYDLETDPSFGESDFLSVALHEIGHALGYGGSDAWTDLISQGEFTGAASTLLFGGSVPLNPGTDHWAEGTDSTVFGTNQAQETAFDPTITQGTRKLVTSLDAAALIDIGWEITEPDASPLGDYNQDGGVTGADYIYWRDRLGSALETGSFAEWSANFGAGPPLNVRNTVVPEPGTLVLAVLGLLSLARRR